jgi:hypothetical protein
MQRRSLLKRGLFGGVLLAGASLAGIAFMPGDASVKPAGKLFAIDAKNFPVLVAVAARVLAGTTASPSDIAMKVDQALRYTSLESQKDLNAALMLLENALAGLLLRGKPATFTELDEKAQDAALYGWRDSRLVLLRGAYHALRKLCLAAHYATPAGWPDTGYPGPSVPKAEPSALTDRGPLVATAPPTPPANEVMP